jgi:hypothetical protein
MIETIMILGTEMPIGEARELWFALGEVFGMKDTGTFWNTIPADTQPQTMDLFCPCNDCALFEDVA